MQTNGFDCGMWVLLTAAAHLRGYHITNMEESDIPCARELLAQIVTDLKT